MSNKMENVPKLSLQLAFLPVNQFCMLRFYDKNQYVINLDKRPDSYTVFPIKANEDASI